jgi:membrane protein
MSSRTNTPNFLVHSGTAKEVETPCDGRERSKGIFGFVLSTFQSWSNHEGTRLSAALAFYATLSLAPLIVLALSVLGLVIGPTSAHGKIVQQAQNFLGGDVARIVDVIVRHAQKPKEGVLATLISLVVVIIGGSGVFSELRSALNKVWDIQPQNSDGISGFIRERLFSYGMVLGIGFLLVASLVLSTVVAAVGHFWAGLLPLPEIALTAINFLISFGALVILFALIFRYVPDARVPWRRIWWGSVVTAFLFTVGKQLIGLYLGKTAVGSAYGAAGSLVVLISWVYYSSMSFYYGAEITCAINARTSPPVNTSHTDRGEPSRLAA